MWIAIEIDRVRYAGWVIGSTSTLRCAAREIVALSAVASSSCFPLPFFFSLTRSTVDIRRLRLLDFVSPCCRPGVT